MYKMTQKHAIKTLNKYPILTLPVPIHAIEEIITDKGYSLINCSDINRPCIFRKELILPRFETISDQRFALAHELGHIVSHGRQKTAIDTPGKHEASADAFALYFTMPPYLFEKDIKRLNEWDLAEKYGMPVEQVLNRAKLCDHYQYQ